MRALAQYTLAHIEHLSEPACEIYRAVLRRENTYNPRSPKNELPADLIVSITAEEFAGLRDRMHEKPARIIRYHLVLSE